MTSASTRADGPRAPNSSLAIIGISCQLPTAPDVASFWADVTGIRGQSQTVPLPAECDSQRLELATSVASRLSPAALSAQSLRTLMAEQRSQSGPDQHRAEALDASHLLVSASAIAKSALADAGIADHEYERAQITVASSQSFSIEEANRLTTCLQAAIPGCSVSIFPLLSAAMQSLANQITDSDINFGLALSLEKQFGAALVLAPQQSQYASRWIARIYCTISDIKHLLSDNQSAGRESASIELDADVPALSVLQCVSNGWEDTVAKAIGYYAEKFGQPKKGHAGVIDQIEAGINMPGPSPPP